MKKRFEEQQKRNLELLSNSKYMQSEIKSEVIPFTLNLEDSGGLTSEQLNLHEALSREAAQIAISSLASLAKIKELDHLGGGLDLISSLILTLAVTDYETKEYTIEHAHTSIGYYASLASFGFLEPQYVIEKFRRSLDIAGHVSWVPGGTQLSGGRLGVMFPVAVGQALGKKAIYKDDAFVICHCGDAGWISGQGLNGFNAADFHRAPITFVMHRNGIQLSGTNKSIMDRDPRGMISAMGIEVLEITNLHDAEETFLAYKEAYSLAKKGKATLIYPTGEKDVSLGSFAEKNNITSQTESFAKENGVTLEQKVWIPGTLMSYRDVHSMLECIFLVNDLPGGEGHHDGSMIGRDEKEVLSNPMLKLSDEHHSVLEQYRGSQKRIVTTKARPKAGTENLLINDEVLSKIKLPDVGETKSARAGVQEGYAALAECNPKDMFVVSCDLDPSTKLGKARTFLPAENQFEMSIEEQAAALIADGLAMSSYKPQLNVVSTFSAFFEGIARECFELWRYQRNLDGANEGINVTFHMSHVGSFTGRDHFSGWSLDWLNLMIGYMPYLDRFYAPSDARSAFIAVKDLAARYGAHIIAIPRDNIPVLSKQDSTEALFNPTDSWEPITQYRKYDEAKRAILAIGAPAYLADAATKELNEKGISTDAYIVNGMPCGEDELAKLVKKYPEGVVTIEDGLIGDLETGYRGFAGVAYNAANISGVNFQAIGIEDPRIAPSEHFKEVWEHFGITSRALVDSVKNL